LYMQHMVCIMHLRWLAASMIRVELEILSHVHENFEEQNKVLGVFHNYYYNYYY